MPSYVCYDCKRVFLEEQLEKIILDGGEGVVYKFGCTGRSSEWAKYTE